MDEHLYGAPLFTRRATALHQTNVETGYERGLKPATTFAREYVVAGFSPRSSIKLTCSRGACVIDVDDLHVGVEIEGRGTLLALADSGRLHPPERNLCFSTDRR